MGFKFILTLIFVLILISMLIFYFTPFNIIHFVSSPKNSNFSLADGSVEMQFYPNMRFPSNDISYKISDCNLQKENDMQYAFENMANITLLRFYPVLTNEEISITCQEKNRYDNGMFVAGEGGPINITVARNFDIITKGEILLIKNSNCPNPNVATHELLHVLGFKHSTNPNNIMYNVTDCGQTISNDVIQLINELYSTPSYPDLILENVSGIMKGRFLEINFSVMNGGFRDSAEFNVTIYAGDKLVEKVDLQALQIGYGRFISMENIWVPQMNVNKITINADSYFEEITKENNKVILEIKPQN